MKTKLNSTPDRVKLSRMVLYLSIVFILAFLSCMGLSADEPESGKKAQKTSINIQLTAGEITEEIQATGTYRMNLNRDFLVEIDEEPLRLEAWMFNLELLSGPVLYAESIEGELEIEPWMLTICCLDLSDLLSE